MRIVFGVSALGLCILALALLLGASVGAVKLNSLGNLLWVGHLLAIAYYLGALSVLLPEHRKVNLNIRVLKPYLPRAAYISLMVALLGAVGIVAGLLLSSGSSHNIQDLALKMFAAGWAYFFYHSAVLLLWIDVPSGAAMDA